MSVLADPTNDDSQVDEPGGSDAVRGPARRLTRLSENGSGALFVMMLWALAIRCG